MTEPCTDQFEAELTRIEQQIKRTKRAWNIGAGLTAAVFLVAGTFSLIGDWTGAAFAQYSAAAITVLYWVSNRKETRLNDRLRHDLRESHKREIELMMKPYDPMLCCGDALYWCPTAQSIECRMHGHGGFDECCSHPELHVPVAVEEARLQGEGS